jgi:flagellar protein FliO/FliZ
MRTLHAFTAAIFGCLLTAPVALAAGNGEDTNLDLGSGETAKNAAQNSASTGGSLVRTIVGLAVVLGVIYGLYWVLKQVKHSKDTAHAGESLETIASLSLGTHRSLHLVRVGAEIVLLGVAEHQITPIRRYTESEAHALGLLEPPAFTLTTLEAEVEEPVAPKGFVDILRSKTVVR